MKVLVPVDASAVALAPIAHLQALGRSGVEVEVLLLNVQPRFHRHIAQFSSRRARDLLRQERSQLAMARAIEALSRTRLRWRAFAEVGRPAERIAAVAEREQVDEVMMGVGRHPMWLRWVNPSIAQGVMERTDVAVTVFARGQTSNFERYAVPVGVAGLAALLFAAE
ncbi:MAG TPA: universal stress protein [Planctomycetota bacterium]|nr:universal stress protein [Planctomycetota bacterium]